MSNTPIHDQLALEQAMADTDGQQLVRAIHARKDAANVPAATPAPIGLREVLLKGWWRA